MSQIVVFVDLDKFLEPIKKIIDLEKDLKNIFLQNDLDVDTSANVDFFREQID